MESKFIEGNTYYYKGRAYSLIKEKALFVELKDSTSTMTVGKENVYTPEEFEEIKNNRRSEHQNWIGP